MKLPAFYPIIDDRSGGGGAARSRRADSAVPPQRLLFAQGLRRCKPDRGTLPERRSAVRGERSRRHRNAAQRRIAPGPGRSCAADARRILPAGSIIGFSTHNEQQLRAGDSEPVDYLAIGPIFATGSKLNPDPVVGLDRLRTLRPLTQKPLVAIGGITRELAPQVFEAGADSVAIIGDLFPNRARARRRMDRDQCSCSCS